MDLPKLFKIYLEGQKRPASKATIKNYLADINQFIRWHQSTHGKNFEPSLLSMELIEEFKGSLLSQGSEGSTQLTDSIQSKTKDQRPKTSISSRSLKRKLSTLRKFSEFLKNSGYIPLSPFEVNNLRPKANPDPWQLKNFRNELYNSKVSNLTIKNYINDIKQFTSWIANAPLPDKKNNALLTDDIFTSINSSVLNSFRKTLIHHSGLSEASINRKLSSLRRYVNFLQSKKLVTGLVTNELTPVNKALPFSPNEFQQDNNPAANEANSAPNLTETISNSDQKSLPKTQDLRPKAKDLRPKTRSARSRFAPFRLMQRLITLLTLGFDLTAVASLALVLEKLQYLLWIAKGKQIFTKNAKYGFGLGQGVNDLRSKIRDQIGSNPIQNLTSGIPNTKHQVPNTRISRLHPTHPDFRSLPRHLRVAGHVRHSRPKWYTKYHSYPTVNYFHFAALIIIMSAIGFGLYHSIVEKGQRNQSLASAPPNAPPRILSFQGRLTDSSDNPISTAKDLRFAIYNDDTASGSALLWQETQVVIPDQDGIFSVLLGSSTAIPSTVFTDQTDIYLGITVQSDTELIPRQRIATVAFAANAETLQGLLPITATGATQQNVVLALDSSGNLTIGGTANPVFSATGGSFTLSGKVLNLDTTAGSNGNVSVAPDGRGLILLNKPIQNSSDNNNVTSAKGAVEIDDMLAVLATSSGQSAFTLVQNSTGPILSASAGATTRFLLANNGTITASHYSTGVAQFDASGVLSSSSLSLSGSLVTGQLPSSKGGTGANLSGATQGSIPYFSSTGVMSALPPSTTGYVLTTNGIGANPTWTSASSLGTNYWQLTTGALAPINTNYDLLVGGSATSSASWQVFGSGINKGTASSSGQLTFRGTTDPKINILNGESFGIRTSPGGDAGLAERLTILNNGNVGIGTTVAQTQLHVVGSESRLEYRPSAASGPIFTLESGNSTAASGWSNRSRIGFQGTSEVPQGGISYGLDQTTPANDQLALYVGSTSTPKLVLQGSGNLGIGSTSPTARLDVNGSTNVQGYATVSASLSVGYSNAPYGPGNAVFSGNVGIGTTSPGSYKLNVQGSILSQKGDGSTSDIGRFYGGVDGNDYVEINSSGTDYINLTVNGIDRVHVNGSNVGIGSTTPGAALDVVGTIRTSSQFLGYDSDSAALPSFTWNSDNNTGIFTPGANTIGFSTAGTEKARFDSNGNLGIGSTAPAYKLDINTGAVAGGIKVNANTGVNSQITFFENNTLQSAITYTPNDDSLKLYNNGLNAIVIKNDGNIGIGSASPSRLLDVSGGSGIVGQFSGRVIGGDAVNANEFATLGQISNGAGQYWQRNLGTLSPTNITDDVLIGGTATSSAKIKLAANGTGVSFFNGGNVGIGTTAPNNLLEIKSNNATTTRNLFLNNKNSTNGAGTGIDFSNDASSAVTASILAVRDAAGQHSLRFYTYGGSNQERMTINYQGNVGIGSTSPQAPLDVVGDIYLTSGLSTYRTAVSDGTVEATKFCTGDGETNCVTDFSALSAGSSIWTDAGAYIYPTSGEVLGNSASAGSNKIAGIYLADSSPLYFGTDNDVNFSFSGSTLNVTQGNNDINFDSNTLFIDGSSNNVGIGTTNPSSTLDIYRTGADNLVHISGDSGQTQGLYLFQNGGTDYGIERPAGQATLGFVSGGRYTFDGSGTEWMRLQNGNLGVGTINPFGLLDIEGSTTSTQGQALVQFNQTGTADIFTASTSGTTKFVIKNNGNVGIGTLSPNSTLAIGPISATPSEITLTSPANYSAGINLNTGPGGAKVYSLGNAGDIRLYVNGSDRLTIPWNTGYVGIGSTIPTALLDVAGNASTSGTLTFRGTTDPKINILNGESLGIRTSPGGDAGLAERLTILSNGNVGIGSTAPTQKLDVAGDITASGDIHANGTVYYGDGKNIIQYNDTWLRLNNSGDFASGIYAGTGIFRTDGTLQVGASGATLDVASGGDFNYHSGQIFGDYSTGSVGIGSTAPAYKLDVSGGSGIVGKFSGRVIGGDAVNANEFATLGQISNGAGQYWQRNLGTLSPTNITDDVLIGGSATSSAKIKLAANGTGVSFFNGGNVGIGSTAPAYKLDVNGTLRASSTSNSVFGNGTTGGLTIGDGSLTKTSGSGFTFDSSVLTSAGTAGGPSHSFSADTNTGMFNASADTLGFSTAGSERLRIASNGNVGIGSTAPRAKLNISGAAADPDLSSNTGIFAITSNTTQELVIGADDSSPYSMWLQTKRNSSDGTSWPLTLNPLGGNVGIGSTAPTQKLDVAGNIGLAANGRIDTNAAGTLTIGGTTQTGLILGRTGQYTRVANLTTNGVVYTSGSNGTLNSEAQLAISRGGTNSTATPTAGAIAYGTGTAYAFNTAGTSGMALLSGGSGAPTFGTLGLTYGGTNANLSSVATGGIIYKGASALAGTGALTGVLKGNGSSAPSAMTGTTNYVTRWTDANTLGTGVLYDNGTNVGISSTSPTAKLDIVSTGTTTNGVNVTANSLTSGFAAYLSSTSTGLTTGGLLNLDWSPGSATTSTGDLLSLNVGANGTIGNIFNVKDNSSSVFSVSQSQITASLPTSFTAAGDTSFAYDLNLTNPTASYIKSSAPLYLQAGESFNSSDLTLRTFNSGNVVIDSDALQVNNAATVSGALSVAGVTTLSNYTTNGGLLYTNASGVVGQTATGTNGQCLMSAGGGSPTWGACSTGSITGSGTTNYVPKFTGSSSIGNSTIYDNGNVGIGSTSPAQKLDVVGNIRSSGVFLAANGSAGAPSYSFTSDTNTGIYSAGADTLGFSTAGSERLRIASNGNVGIGSTAPAQKLDVNGSIRGNNGLTISSGTISLPANQIDSSEVSFNYADSSSKGGPALTLGAEDNRTISPSELANAQMKFGFTAYNNNNSSPYADFIHLRSYTDSSGGKDNLLVFNKTDGLGMRLYQQTFNSATAYSTYKDIALVDNGSTLNYVPKFSSVGTTVSMTNSSIFDNGNVGIGTTSPAGKFQIGSGGASDPTLYFTSSTTFPRLYLGGTDTSVSYVINKTKTSGIGYFGESGDTGGYNFRGSGNFSLEGALDANNTGTNDIAGTLNLSGNTLTSSGDLTINPSGGNVLLADTDVLNVGGAGATAYNFFANSTSGASGSMADDNDLYIEGNLEVDGTIIGAVNPGFTTGSVIFQGPSGMAQDNSNFFWDDTSNRLGIGTNSPSTAFQVHTTSDMPFSTYIDGPNPSLAIRNVYDSATTGLFRLHSTSNSLRIQQNTAVAGDFSTVNDGLTMANSGNIGIGSTNPGAKLDVNGNIAVGGTTVINSSRIHLAANGSAASPAFTFSSDTNNGMFLATTDTLGFSTAGSERLRIASNGNVGIGSTGPTQKLDIGGNAKANNYYLNAANGYGIGFWNGSPSTYGIFMSNSATYQYGDVTDYYIANVMSSGTGRGFTWSYGSTPSMALNANSGNLAIKGTFTGNGSGNNYFAGNIGIGTTTPAEKLHVNGNLRADGRTTKFSNQYAEYRWYWGGGSGDNDWKTIANVATGTGIYDDMSFSVKIMDINSNNGSSDQPLSLQYYVSIRGSAAGDNAVVSGPIADYVRVIKTASNTYELQVRQIVDWKHMMVTAQELSTCCGTPTVTYVDSPVDGSTSGTIYSAAADHTDYATNLYARGNVGIGTTSPSTFKLEVAGHTGPSADSTYDLGTTSVRWRNGYFDTLYGDGSNLTGITASSMAFSGITTGTNTTAAMTVGTGASLTYSGSGTINASSLNGISSGSFLRSDTSDNFTSGTLTLDAGTTLAVNGTLDANGVFTLGDNGDTGAIDTSDWDISTTGVMTGISGITTDGGYTQSGSGTNTFTGLISSQLETSGSTANLRLGCTGSSCWTNANGAIEFLGSGVSHGQIAYYPSVNGGSFALLDASGALGDQGALSLSLTFERLWAGDIISDGNIGIGTTSPLNKLEILDNNSSSFGGSNNDSTLYIKNSSGSNTSTTLTLAPNSGSNFNIMMFSSAASPANAVLINQRNNAPMTLLTNDTARLTILGGGNVGIGTTNPGAKLEIVGTAKISDNLTIGGGSGGTSGKGIIFPSDGSDASSIFGEYSGSSSNLVLRIADDSAGDSIVQRVNLVSMGDKNQVLTSWAGTNFYDAINVGQLGSQSVTNYNRFGTNTTSHSLATSSALLVSGSFEVDNNSYFDGTTNYFSGNIGIGTTSPDVPLSVNGQIKGTRLIDSDNSDYFLDPASSSLSLTTQGNVGIGTTSPIGRLEVSGGNSSTTIPQLVLSGGTTGTVGDLYIIDSAGSSSGIGWGAKAIGVNIQNKVNGSNQVVQRTTSGGITGAGAIYLGGDEVSQGVFGVLGTPQGSTAGTVLSELFTVLGGGNVGIGTTSPSNLLHVNGAMQIGSYPIYPSTNTLSFNENNTSPGTSNQTAYHFTSGSASKNILFSFAKTGTNTNYFGNDGTNFYLANEKSSSGAFIFKKGLGFGSDLVTDGTEIMRIDNNSGNVGIGATNPGSKLDIKGSESSASGLGAAIGIENTAAGGAGWYFRVGATGTDTPAGALSLANAGAYRMFVNSLGYVSLGDNFTTGTGRLNVQGAVTGKALVQLNETGNQDIFTASASGTTRFTIKNNGNVGIGTANPTSSLHVRGDKITLGAADNTTWQIFTKRTDGENAGDNDCDSGNINESDSNTLCFRPGTGSTNTAMKIYESGDVVINDQLYDYADPDIAEYMPVNDPTIYSGDILAVVDPSNRTEAWNYENMLTGKANQQYQSSIIGVVSTGKPKLVGTRHPDEIRNLEDKIVYGDQRAVTLAGRIPTKVSTVNGPIQPGDPITASQISGIGMKATRPGTIVGRALQAFTGENDPHAESISCPTGTDPSVKCAKIIVLLNMMWVNPEVQIADSGNLSILGDGSTEQPFTAWAGQYQFQNKAGFAEAVIAKLTAGLLTTQQLVVNGTSTFLGTITAGTINASTIAVDNLSIGGTALRDYIINVISSSQLVIGNSQGIVSPVATIDHLAANVISPLAGDTNQTVKVKGNLHIEKTASASGDLAVDGSATISGSLTASALNTADASISGTLRAGHIIADQIDGLDARIASLSAANITASQAAITNIYNTYNTASNSGVATSSGYLAQGQLPPNFVSDSLYTGVANIASLSADLAYVPSFSADTATITEGLMVFGTTSLSDTSVVGQLSVDGSLIIADNSINVLGSTFDIQSLRQGDISFEGGLVAIDTDGNLTVGGDAVFAKDVSVGGTLTAGLISPIPDHDLIIQLPGYQATDSATLAVDRPGITVKNGTGSAVLKITDVGDIIASGAALASQFQVVRGVNADTSLTETVATASAGTATIKAGQYERTIISPYVTDKSLIYITPLTNTQGLTPYVARQTAEDSQATPPVKGSFTVRIPVLQTKDVKVNWWIIN